MAALTSAQQVVIVGPFPLVASMQTDHRRPWYGVTSARCLDDAIGVVLLSRATSSNISKSCDRRRVWRDCQPARLGSDARSDCVSADIAPVGRVSRNTGLHHFVDIDATRSMIWMPHVLLWIGRGLGVFYVAFFGFFLLAHLVGDEPASEQPLTPSEIGIFIAIGASAVGVGLSFWKACIGGVVMFVSWGAMIALDWHIVANIFFGISAIAGVLLIASSMRQVTKER